MQIVKSLLLTILILKTLFESSFGATPTVEGLFRNSNNQDINGNIISLKISIEAVKENSPSPQVSVSGSDVPTTTTTVDSGVPTVSISDLKLYFIVSEGGGVELIQLDYPPGKFDENRPSRARYFSNFTKLVLQDNNLTRDLFYSSLCMFATNLSRPIALVLKRVNSDFPLNENILNEELQRLFARQKKHLIQVRSGSVSQNAPSPFRPTSEDEKRKVNELLNTDMYKKTDFVSMTKEGSEFYWMIKMEGLEALFTNNEHRIEKLAVHQHDTGVEMHFSDFSLLDGAHEIAKTILVSEQNLTNYKIKITSLNHSTMTRQKIIERLKNYEEQAAKMKSVQKTKLPILF